jgi:hypothetical protein
MANACTQTHGEDFSLGDNSLLSQYAPKDLPNLQSGDDSYDPFAPENSRLPASFIGATIIREHLTKVSVGRPKNTEWVQVHPHPDYRRDVALIEYGDNKDVYMVTPSIANKVMSECRPATLFTYVTRYGTLGLWRCWFNNSDRENDWVRTLREAAEIAMKGQWIRCTSDKKLGAYKYATAPGITTTPIWPEQNLTEIMRIAFRGKLIDSLNHEVLRQLRGEE